MVNGAFLMGAFMIIILKMSADDAWEKFKPYHQLFKHYRDASTLGPNASADVSSKLNRLAQVQNMFSSLKS